MHWDLGGEQIHSTKKEKHIIFYAYKLRFRIVDRGGGGGGSLKLWWTGNFFSAFPSKSENFWELWTGLGFTKQKTVNYVWQWLTATEWGNPPTQIQKIRQFEYRKSGNSKKKNSAIWIPKIQQLKKTKNKTTTLNTEIQIHCKWHFFFFVHLL